MYLTLFFTIMFLIVKNYLLDLSWINTTNGVGSILPTEKATDEYFLL